MCIIIYKPKGKEIPKDHLINSFMNNPDGAGFMVQTEKGVHIQKGYMDNQELLSAVYSLPDLKDRELVLHFRFATSGLIDEGNCHPFPLSGKKKNLRQLDIMTNIGIVHNGVILMTSNRKSDLSDTQLFIKEYLNKLHHEGVNLLSVTMLKMIQAATKSKFAFMTKDNVYILGDFINCKGVYYSNSDYKYLNARYTTTKTNKDYNNYFGWDEEYQELEKGYISGNKLYNKYESLIPER